MFLLVALCLHAQAAEPPKTPEPSPPVSVARIRRDLERERTLELPTTVSESTGPVFRVHVNEKSPPVERLWTDETLRPLYVQTRRPMYHHEFLAKVTPDEFRAGTLYPIGVDLLAVADLAATGVRKALRSAAEARARAVVKKELASLLEARKAESEKDR
jgi:hypothetical protein